MLASLFIGLHNNFKTKSMKKLLIAIAALLISQSVSAQFSIAPEVGAQMSNMNVKSSAGIGFSPNSKIAYRAGLNMAYEFNEKLNLHAGVFYSAKGFKSDFSGVVLKFNPNYVEIPVYVNYNIVSFPGGDVFIGAGPYVGYCIGGKTKTSGSFMGVSFDDESDLNIGSDATNDDLKPLDFGANVNAGIVTNMGLYARFNYGMGFANLLPGGTSSESMKNNGFALSIGYQIKF